MNRDEQSHQPAGADRQNVQTPTEVRDILAYDRNHLANERTFAAWLRTGLSVAAGGIAVGHLVPEYTRDSTVALLLGIAFVLLGILVIAYGAHQFARVAADLARQSGRRSPAPARAVYALTAIVAVLLVALLLLLWSRRDDRSGSNGSVMRAEWILDPGSASASARTLQAPRRVVAS
jgi:putative membrane protein